MKWIILAFVVGALLMWGILAVVDGKDNKIIEAEKCIGIQSATTNICDSKGYIQLMRIEESIDNTNNYNIVYSLCDDSNGNKIKIYELKAK